MNWLSLIAVKKLSSVKVRQPRKPGLCLFRRHHLQKGALGFPF